MASLAVVARPYARAVFELAREAEDLASWSDALSFAAIAVDLPDMAALLADPRFDDAQLAAAIQDAGGDRMHASFGNFLKVLAENGRLRALPEIAAAYASLRAEAERSLHVEVASAAKLDTEQRSKLEQSLAKRFQRSIEANYHIDTSLLGGVVVRAGDTVIDGSLQNKLQRLAGALQNA